MDDVLWELICSVGENENHPLDPLMTFIFRLIANYEDKYVPKLTERFPELAEETPVEIANENNNPPPYASELSDEALAAHGFFSIGCLLWEGGKAEKARAAYDTAIRLQPDYAEVYNNRGNIKSGLDSHDAALKDYDEAIRLNPNFAEAYSNRGAIKFRLDKHAAALTDLNAAIRLQPDFINAYANRGMAQLGLNNIDEAKTDFQIALELAEQQGQIDLTALIEKLLQEPDRAEEKIILDKNTGSGASEAVPKEENKESRRGGQWKGKVKTAEDFDELPESFMEFFREENA